ncbi:unnamed protein product [Pedinophyceae sp. YPF-701]|nr:unnamed protein product [Pedinophyceae sp. YPF-701]
MIVSNPASGASGDGEGLDMAAISSLAGGQRMVEGEVRAKLFTGTIRKGELTGTRVSLKAYPPASQAQYADIMAANELKAHSSLQTPDGEPPENVAKLLGGFVVKDGAGTGEQWLVFRAGLDGTATLEEYAKVAAEATSTKGTVGEGEFWDRFDYSRALRRRQVFLLRAIRGAMQGLASMHSRGWLHQSLGPQSVLLSTTEERDAARLNARLRDLAFAVKCSNEALMGGPTLADLWEAGKKMDAERDDPANVLSESLWQRARSEGAVTTSEQRNFGIADDIYSAGLLLAYACFVPLSEMGSVDGPTLLRLLETTFRDDFEGFREYATADDRWSDAVDFLNIGKGAGWELLEAMLAPDWRKRPTAESCLKHPFLTGEAYDM